MNAVVPQNSSGVPAPSSPWMRRRYRPSPPGATCSTRRSAGPLSERTAAGLAFSTPADKTLRWDTVHELPPDVDGKTRWPRRAPNHATSLSGCMPSRMDGTAGAGRPDVQHRCQPFLLDIQWYLHQALAKAGAPWDSGQRLSVRTWRCCWSACRGWKSGMERRHAVCR